jgi:phage terminase small subunit
MTQRAWKSKIKKACEEAGTYRPYFDHVIATLADILSKRDKAQEQFEKSGGNAIIKHTNKSGATNLEQNPALRMINDLNRDALQYWRDLGLTPAGLKKINEKAMQKQKASALTEALKALG